MIFDLVLYSLTAIAMIFGFRSGLLRSMATIIGYVMATPVALVTGPNVSEFLVQRLDMPPGYRGVVMAFNLIVIGMIFGELLRRSISNLVGPQVSFPDRIAGAALGAVRIGLVAVTIVVIFDRIIPANRQPPFLVDSMLRPHLSSAGQAGVKALPPEVVAYIDRVKRERGL